MESAIHAARMITAKKMMDRMMVPMSVLQLDVEGFQVVRDPGADEQRDDHAECDGENHGCS